MTLSPLTAILFVCLAQTVSTNENRTVRNEVRTAKHDDFGRLIREVFEHDDDKDGTIDRRMTSEFEYDEAGRMCRKQATYDDNVADRQVRRETSVFTYNDTGALAEEVVHRDQDSDGIDESKTVSKFEYRDNQLRSKVSVHHVGGSIDRTEKSLYRHSAEGLLLEEIVETDTNNDGAVDSRKVIHFRYDGGRLVEKTTEQDTDLDGAADRAESVLSTVNGGATTETRNIDLDGDGVVDQSDVTTRSRNSGSGGNFKWWWVAGGLVSLGTCAGVAVLLMKRNGGTAQARS